MTAVSRGQLAKVGLTTPSGIIAMGFGSGLSPWFPGTVGSLAAMAPGLWLKTMPTWIFLTVMVGTWLVGLWATHATSQNLKIHDHSAIVIDEFVGQWLVLLIIPVTGWHDWPWWLAAFVLFRFFDILKFGPVRWCDRRLPGAWGVMFDDVFAGLYALAILWSIQQLL